jgi:hypothetical protein
VSSAKLFPYRALQGGIAVTWTVKSQGGGKVPELSEGFIDASELPESGAFKICFEMRLSNPKIKSLVPQDESSDPPVRMCLLVRSPMSSHRSLIECRKSGSKGMFTGEMVFRKKEFTRTVTLTPVLVRNRAREFEEGFAAHDGAILATGEPIRVAVDEPPETSGNYLPVTPENFSQSGNPTRRENPDLVYSVDLSGPGPRIFINTGLKDVEQIFYNEARRGKSMRARTALFDVIATGVWTSLLTVSTVALAASLEGGDVDVEEALAELDGWQRDILESWAEELTGAESRQDALSEMGKMAEDSTLSQRISFVVQRQAETEKNFEGLRKWVRDEDL